MLLSPNLKSIIVDKRNKDLKSEDGILFTKDGAYLLKYPAKKQEKNIRYPTTWNSSVMERLPTANWKLSITPNRKKE